jgi:hypothetical protein
VARGLSFIGGFVTAGVLFWAVGFAARSAALFASADIVENLAVAAYLLTVQALLNALVYATLTAIGCRGVRRTRRTVAIDAGAGAIASLLVWTGVSLRILSPVAIVSGAAGAVWIGFVLPGVLAGAVAIPATRWAAPRSAPPSAGGSTASTDTRA